MKLPKYPVWGKIHIAPAGGETLCGTIERDNVQRVESGDYIENITKLSNDKKVCKSCLRFVRCYAPYTETQCASKI